MTATLLTFPVFRAFDSNGAPLAGGLLYSYQAGTTTPLATYVDQAGVTQNTNPVVLDSTGTANVWLGDSTYKLVLKDKDGVQQWSVDNIQSEQAIVNGVYTNLANTSDVSKGDALIGVKSTLTGGTARTQHSKNSDYISVKDFGAVCDGVTDDSTAVQTANAAAAGRPLLFVGICKIGTSTTITTPIVDTMEQIFTVDSIVKINNGGFVRPEWFGANTIPGTTDMSAAINAASESVITTNKDDNGSLIYTGYVLFAGKTYRHDTTLTYTGAPWVGSGKLSTILDYHGSVKGVDAVGASDTRKVLSICDMTLYGDNATGTPNGLHLGWNQRSLKALDNVRIDKYPNGGILFEADIWIADFRSVDITNCGKCAMNQGADCNNLFQMVWFNTNVENNGDGTTACIRIPNSGSCQNWVMYGGDFESNNCTSTFYFKGGIQEFHDIYFEETPASCFLMDGNYFSISGCYFIPTAGTVSQIRAIGLSSGSVRDNTFYPVHYWEASTDYVVGDWVQANYNGYTTTYKCATANTSSSSFATDFGAGYWTLEDASGLSVEDNATVTASGNFNMVSKVTIVSSNEPALLSGAVQVVDGWGTDNLGASANSALSRPIGSSAWDGVFLVPKTGYVTGISMSSDAARSAGTATATLIVNGTERSGIQAILDSTNTTIAYSNFAKEGGVWVKAGDLVKIGIKTSSDWSPITANVAATLDFMF